MYSPSWLKIPLSLLVRTFTCYHHTHHIIHGLTTGWPVSPFSPAVIASPTSTWRGGGSPLNATASTFVAARRRLCASISAHYLRTQRTRRRLNRWMPFRVLAGMYVCMGMYVDMRVWVCVCAGDNCERCTRHTSITSMRTNGRTDEPVGRSDSRTVGLTDGVSKHSHAQSNTTRTHTRAAVCVMYLSWFPRKQPLWAVTTYLY